MSAAPVRTSARRRKRVAAALATGPAGAPADDRAPEWVAARHAGAAALTARRPARRRAGARPRQRHRPLRLRREPLPALSEGRRAAPERARHGAAAGVRARAGEPLVFRAGGTSLNGQGQSDGILVDARHHWRGVEVLEDGAAARVRPGTILGHANRVLSPHGRKLGPDPASTEIATLGGVLANNSGGMRCGTTKDTYSTLRSLRFVLPSGTTIDTRRAGCRRALRRRRARARRRPRGDPRRDPRRRRSARADPAQVRDQEHDRLPALRLPRRRRAARDLPAAARRLGGHARLRRRGDARDRAGAAA